MHWIGLGETADETFLENPIEPFIDVVKRELPDTGDAIAQEAIRKFKKYAAVTNIERQVNSCKMAHQSDRKPSKFQHHIFLIKKLTSEDRKIAEFVYCHTSKLNKAME